MNGEEVKVGTNEDEADDDDNVFDDDDIVWEDGDEIQISEEVQVNLTKDEKPQETAKKKEEKKRYLSKQEKEALLNIHKVNLMCLSIRAVKLMEWSTDTDLVAIVRPLIPASFFDSKECKFSVVQRLLLWYRKRFKTLDDRDITDEEGRSGSPSDRLEAVVRQRIGAPSEVTQVFCAVCRILGWKVRLLSTLDPSTLKELRDIHLKRRRVTSGRDFDLTPKIWLEVYGKDHRSQEKWIHLDCVDKQIDRPHSVIQSRKRQKLMPYILAIDLDLRAVDVTKRYAVEWHKVAKLRVLDKKGFWTNFLEILNRNLSGDGATVDSMMDLLESDEETDREFEFPSSVEAYREHKHYIAKKYLTKYQYVEEEDCIGVVKGQKIYPRKKIHDLYSVNNWLRTKKRKVRDEEVKSPLKVLRRGKDGAIHLFARWQTEEFKPPAAIDGIVPKNKYGNIEVWDGDGDFLPIGTVHIRLPDCQKVAEKLGMDHSKAVVGFTSEGQRSTPIVDGIVICQQNERAFLDAYEEWDSMRIEKDIALRNRRTIDRWKRLTVGLLTRKRLEEEYL